MGTVGYAFAAVDANKGLTCRVKVYGLHRAGLGALPATDAELLPHHHAAALPLGIGVGRAGLGAGRRVAGQADPRFEPG